MERAYPTTKRSDVVIDFGEAFGAFEVVSGQLTSRRASMETALRSIET